MSAFVSDTGQLMTAFSASDSLMETKKTIPFEQSGHGSVADCLGCCHGFPECHAPFHCKQLSRDGTCYRATSRRHDRVRRQQLSLDPSCQWHIPVAAVPNVELTAD